MRRRRDDHARRLRQLPRQREQQRRLSARADDRRHALPDVQRLCQLHTHLISDLSISRRAAQRQVSALLLTMANFSGKIEVWNRIYTLVLSVRLFTDEKCFGPGVAALLTLVKTCHSLRAAAMEMGMAYPRHGRF